MAAGLKLIYPEPYFSVEKVGGKGEEKHGCDILVRIPSLTNDYEYVIAIQVKNYSGHVDKAVLEQLAKADTYFDDNNCKLIDKILIVTNSDKEENEKLLEEAGKGVRVIFENDLKKLLERIAKLHIAKEIANM